jgi:dihydrodipicolinate synthase/N-acetylneuraminate lyase
MSQFGGVIASAVTPRGKQGDVDYGAAFELIDHCCRGGVDAVLLCGDPADYAAFPPDARSRLVYLAVKRSRRPVLAGVGSPDLDTSLSLAREAVRAGADGVLLPPPLCLPLDEEDLVEYYTEFARGAGAETPVLLWDCPPGAAARLLETGHFAGIASDGDAAHPAGDAFVSSVACAVPELVVAMLKAPSPALTAWFEEFRSWTGRLPPTVAVKTALTVRGLKVGPLPLPLAPSKQRLLEEFRAWFQAWLPNLKSLTVHA